MIFKESLLACCKRVVGFICFKKEFLFLFWLFLFPFFYVLHAYNEYFGLLPINIVFEFLFKYFIFTLVLILSSLLVLIERKAFLFAFFILYIYFFFGAIHDFLKVLNLPLFITSYSFLLVGILFSVLVLFFLLKKSNRGFLKSVKILVYFLVLSVGIDLCITGFYIITQENKNNTLLSSNRVVFNKNVPSFDSLPDIFFLIMDSYTSSLALENEFRFSNTKMDSTFNGKGFYTVKKSFSNYNNTPYSLSATLDLNYLKSEVEAKPLSNKLLLRAIKSLNEVSLIPFFKTCGYEFKNHSIFSVANKSIVQSPFFASMPEKVLTMQTLWGRVKRDIYWNFVSKDFISGKPLTPQSYYDRKNYVLRINEQNYNFFLTELTNKNAQQPRFVYSHILLPHPPYYLDSNGNHNLDQLVFNGKIDSKKGYIGQLQYANKLLENIINSIPNDPKRPLVIIIQGDHGSRINLEDDRLSKFANLNTIYFSDNDYSTIYNNMTSVNTFRVVLNKYFNQQMSIVEDRTTKSLKIVPQ